MEQQLHAWFRYAVFLGIYARGTATGPKNYGIVVLGAQKKRRRWLIDKHNLNLQRIYIFALLPLILTIYVHGVLWRSRMPILMPSWFVGTMLFTSAAITNVLIISETLWRQPEHEAFLLLLQQIDVSLKLRLRLDMDERHMQTSICRFLLYLLLFSLVGLALYLLTTLWLEFMGYFWYGLWFIITIRVRIIQLLVYVRVLLHYMECLSTKLQQLVACRMAPTRQMLDINYVKLQSLEYLLAIKEIYALLFEAFHLLNEFAGWSLFSIVTGYMLDISCYIYWALLSLDGFSSRQYFYIASILWLCPVITIVWHICWLCDSCKQLDRLIANLLSKILIASSSTSWAAYRLVLQQFSTQLQLQCIEVSAQRFFILDMRLLTSISTAIAAYLVIIKQFLTP